MEVWNAAEDNGGATPASVKAAFNALKYADRSLTKEKVLSTGQHYCAELQRVFDTDATRKNEEKARLEAERTGRRQNLTQSIAAEEAQIAALQKSLAQKRDELQRIDADYDPRLHEIDQKIAAGRATIQSLTDEMNVVLRIVKSEL
jgi:chromosome segregation ATPase